MRVGGPIRDDVDRGVAPNLGSARRSLKEIKNTIAPVNSAAMIARIVVIVAASIRRNSDIFALPATCFVHISGPARSEADRQIQVNARG